MTSGWGTVVEEQPSRLAGWSATLASLSLPVLILTAIAHRSRAIDTTSAYVTMAVGFSLAGLAVLIAAAAFAGIWQEGHRGAGRAAQGLIVGMVVLAFPLYGAWQLIDEPRLTDIATSLDDPPRFVLTMEDRDPGDAQSQAIGAVEARLQSEAHPDIVPRFYPVGTARVFEEARAIVARRGWQVLEARAPSEEDESARIEAVAVTLVFGFRHDVVVRIQAEEEGALVDMRSAARRGAHDLGVNADRIRRFFTDLDRALQGVTGG